MTEPMFYCEHLPQIGEIARLREDEARHAAGARRLKSGDALWLFDGRGGIARARFQSLQERGRVLEAVIEERQQQPPMRPRIHLACALPKGDRASVLLDMASQLGMTSFTPLLCERSVVDPGAGALDRLRRVTLEACKQSRRAYLPEVHSPARFLDVVARGPAVWIAHPGGEPIGAIAAARDEDVTLMVGPEGGFTEAEISLAAARGVRRVALGAGILRIETAAVALLATVVLNQKSVQAS